VRLVGSGSEQNIHTIACVFVYVCVGLWGGKWKEGRMPVFRSHVVVHVSSTDQPKRKREQEGR